MVLPTKESDFNMNDVSIIKPTELKYILTYQESTQAVKLYEAIFTN